MAKRKKGVTVKITGCSEPKIESLKLENSDYNAEYTNAIFYLRTLVSTKDLKKESIKWIRDNKEFDTKLYTSLEDWRFAVAGKFCYLLNRGAELPENAIEYLESKVIEFDEIVQKRKSQKEAAEELKSKLPKKSVQDYLREHAHYISGEHFEPWFDSFVDNPKKFKAKDYDPLTVMRTEELKQGHVRYIIKFYEPYVEEFKSLVDGKASDDLKECYNCYTKPQLRECLKLYESIISSANMVLETAKATRKKRTKKAVDPSKLVSRLKIATEDARTGTVSVNPVDILGAKEVWFYNMKTRKLGKFVANDSTGLGVKGASIIDFNETKSIQKTLRKPPEQIKKFKKVKTRQMNKEFKEIKAMETQVKGKVNTNVVIFQVFK